MHLFFQHPAAVYPGNPTLKADSFDQMEPDDGLQIIESF